MPRSHKSLPRLFVEDSLAAGDRIALDTPRTHHLINVLRRGAGDRCILFNGRDGAFLAEIAETTKKAAIVRLIEQSAAQAPKSDLWFGFAPIKRLDYQVQKATEMGAGTIQPVITSNVQNPRIKTDKMRANVIEAAQQCEVIALPEVAEPAGLDALLDHWPQTHPDRTLIFCDEDSASASPVETIAALKGKRLGLLIGPEGGFTQAERTRLHSLDFVTAISLGPRILRADTAAVAALALIQAVAGDWQAALS